MERLEKLREEISKIDERMTELFKERMRVSKEIGKVKEENHLPVFDPLREKEVLENGRKKMTPELQELYEEFLKKNMELSKRYQEMNGGKRDA